jgi:hypothetical protein
MARAEEHRVVIERRGRSHRAFCACGWTGHAWNELRPAEADAWHHLFGEETVIDVSAAGASAASALTQGVSGRPGAPTLPPDSLPPTGRRTPSVEAVVNRARAFADSPSPYSHQAVRELWRTAAEDQSLLEAAISEIADLLWRHSQRSAGTADSEWLQLITAKRLLQETIEREQLRSYT